MIMAHTTTYSDLIGREHSVTRYAAGDRLTYRSVNGITFTVVATGPGDPMVPNHTPVRVTSRSAARHGWKTGDTFVASNAWLTYRPLRYRGVTIERSRVTGYYLAHTTRGLTADTLAGMRELIREFPPVD